MCLGSCAQKFIGHSIEEMCAEGNCREVLEIPNFVYVSNVKVMFMLRNRNPRACVG